MANKKQEKRVLICKPTLPLFSVPWLEQISVKNAKRPTNKEIHIIKTIRCISILYGSKCARRVQRC